VKTSAYELLQLVSCTIGAEQEDYAPWQPNVSIESEQQGGGTGNLPNRFRLRHQSRAERAHK